MEECIYSCDDESQLTSSTYTPRSGFELNENYIILEPEDKTLKSTYEISSTFFCRILTLIYFFSFLSNFNQILPLFGNNGLFSTTNTGLKGTTTGLTGGSTVFTGYDNIKLENKTFYESISEFPSIFLIIPITDFTLRLIPLIGLFISFLMFLTGFHCMYSFLILWILKLSLVALFKFIPKLLSDLLLLEIGFLTIFIFSPFKFFDKYLNLEVSSIIIWSFRFLSYRIIFLSGIYRIFLKTSVKYILTSIPLPTFFTHLLLRLITKYNFLNHLLTAVLLFFEVILSIFLITPFRNCNIFAGIGLLVYSCIFMILGNFGPFYILLGLCSLFCLDDQFLSFTKSKFNPFIKSDHLMKSISIDIIESIIDQYDGDVDGVGGVDGVDGVGVDGVDIENFTNIPENTLNSRNALNNSRISRNNSLDGGLDSTVDGTLDSTVDGTLDSTVEEHIFEMNIENISKIFTREFYKKIFNDILIIFFIIIIIISSILLFLFPKYKNFKAFLLFLFCLFLKSYCENKFTTPHHTIEGNNPIHSTNTVENTKYIVKSNNTVEGNNYTVEGNNIVENTIVYGNKYKLCVLYILYILQCILIFEIIKNGPNIWSFLLWIGIIELQINLSKKINNFHYLIKMIIKSFLFIHFLFYNFKIFYSSVTVLGPTATVVPSTTTTNTNTGLNTFNTNTGLINTPYNLNNLNNLNTPYSTLNTVNTTTGLTGVPTGGVGIGMNNFYSINNYRNIYNINKERYEIVIEGTNENFVTTNTHWIEYYFKRKPSKLDQFPHFIPFYQYYFDNLLINFVNSVTVSPVTVLGQADSSSTNTNTLTTSTNNTTNSTIGASTVTEGKGANDTFTEENSNKIAAVTKSRESGTFVDTMGDGVNTKGPLGTVTKETPLGAVGTTVGREPDTVTYKMDKYIFNIIRMLLMGSEEIKKLINDPFEGTKPKYVRILIYKYYFTSTFQNKTHNWYYRNFITQFIPPLCYSPVTVTGTTASNGTDSTVVPGTKETKDPTGASTVTEEKNLNKIAAVTNFGESDTNSNTKGKGTNLDTTTGDTTVGASTVTENNIINRIPGNNKSVSLNNTNVQLNNKSVPLNMAESFNHKLPNVDGIIITSK